ncbi:YfhO family protein [Patescibacteria group bacterium]|nr:YfhO family protein [Patescibacteria group bacterium]
MNKFFSKYFPYLLLGLVISSIYYKFFLLGKIPFPGDLLIVSYSPWLDYYKFPVQNPIISDVFSQLFLWKHLAIEAFRNLQWPLWNPYSFTGTPLLATYQSSALYPLNILLFLPQHYGWGLYIYSQTLIASLAFYLFASQIVKSKLASITGAIMFSLGGLMTTWLELGTSVHAIAWLPLALYSIRKFINVQKFRFILISIFSLSAIVLAGNAQITTYSFVIVSLYTLWLCWKNKITPSKIFLVFFTLFGSISLTALQLLPSFDLLQNSIRQSDSYTHSANFGLLNIKDVLRFFIPDYFGNPVTRNYWGTLNYTETSGFLGTLILPLLIYALFKIRSKVMFFLSILFLFSLLFTFSNPLSQAFYNMNIPLLTSSYASRMLFITLFSASLISVLTINHILKHQAFCFFKKTILWSWSTIIGIIFGTLLTHFFIQKILLQTTNKEYLNLYLNDSDFALQNFSVAARNSFIPFALLTTLLIITLILNSRIYKPLAKKFKPLFINKTTLLMSIFFVLLVLDLGRYFLKFNPFVSQELIFPNVPALQFLQDQPGVFRVGREHAEVFPPNTWIAYNLQSIEGYDPIHLNQFGKFMNFLNGGDIRSNKNSRYAELLNYKSPFLDIANVKYFIGIGRDRNGHIPGDFANYKFNEAGYKRIFKDGSAIIFENPSVKERVYFAKKTVTASTREIENKFMNDKTFDPRDTITLSDHLKIATVSGKGKAIIASYSSNKVVIKTDTPSDEILILADQYEKGWKATIDGKTTNISPANLIFRAVKIPAGSHEVIFRYWPKSFDIGLKISLSSLLLIIIISSFAIKTRRF